MNLGFAPPGDTAPAMIPDDFAEAALAARPQRSRGGQPRAVVILVEVQTRALGT